MPDPYSFIRRWRALAWLLGVCSCRALVAAEQQNAAVCDALLPGMRQSHIPDMAIACLSDGKIRTYYCTLEDRQLTPNAVFEAGSLGKPVFAVAVLALVQQGKLDLDRSLATYLPGPYRHQQSPFRPGPADVVTDARLSRVTARMILSHTSGLPNWAFGRPLSFVADPGQKWSYSGEGYVYLQRVIENITGESLQPFVQKTVFEPLGMSDSSFVWRSDYAGRALQPHASDGAQPNPEHYANAVAATTLYTTLDDYGKFMAALVNPKPGSVFAMVETMQVQVNASMKLGWGLGIAIEDTAHKTYFHWGANPGFQAFFMIEPAARRGVLFLTDSDHGLDMVDAVADYFLPGAHPALRFPLLHPKD